VGCLVDSDGTCPECQAGFEQFCPNFTLTYNFPDKHTGGVTYGGYSDSIVVKERFVLSVPTNLDLAGTAPLLCAGITTYSPMRHWGVTKGKKVGVVGLGGLGHMGVKFAHAWSAHGGLHHFSQQERRRAAPRRRRGRPLEATPTRWRSTPAASTSFSTRLPPITTSTPTSTCCAATATSPWWARRKNRCPSRRLRPHHGTPQFSGSPIGGIRETQEMLDFCGQHNITSDVEVIPVQKINEAYERLLKSDVKYRFSIDMASLKSE
jgi:alcohol dehydrogenase (NADP+)